MSPVFVQLANQHPGIKFLKVDIDELQVRRLLALSKMNSKRLALEVVGSQESIGRRVLYQLASISETLALLGARWNARPFGLHKSPERSFTSGIDNASTILRKLFEGFCRPVHYLRR